MHQHMRFVRRGVRRGNLRRYRTLRACWLRGISVIAQKLVTDLSLADACSLERWFILIYGRRDLRTGCLLNASAGGSGPRLLAASTRARLADAGRRHMARPDIQQMLNEKKRSPEARAKLSASKKGQHPSTEARAKMSASCRARNERDPEKFAAFLACRVPGGNQGNKHSAENRAKISEALRAQWRDPVIRARRSAFFAGQKDNPALKAAVAAARVGRRPMLGKRHSPETRLAMSIAQQRRRAREQNEGAGA